MDPKTTRRLRWMLLGLFILSALPAAAGFGTIRRHGCKGTEGSWKYSIAGETYRYLKVDVPVDAAKLTVETGIGAHRQYGNVSLYVRYGALPTGTSPNTGVSQYPGFRQRVQVSNPPAGRYYIRLYGRSRYRTCLKVVVTPKPPPPLTGTWRGKGTARYNGESRTERFSVKLIQDGDQVKAKYSHGEYRFSARGTRDGNEVSLKISPFTYREGDIVATLTGTIRATVDGNEMEGSIRAAIRLPDRTVTVPGTFRLTKQ